MAPKSSNSKIAELDKQIVHPNPRDAWWNQVRALANNLNVYMIQAHIEDPKDRNKSGLLSKINCATAELLQLMEQCNQRDLVGNVQATLNLVMIVSQEIKVTNGRVRQAIGAVRDAGGHIGLIGVGAGVGACVGAGVVTGVAFGALCLVLNGGSGTVTFNSLQESPSRCPCQLTAADFKNIKIQKAGDSKKLPWFALLWESGAGNVKYWLFREFEDAVTAMDGQFSSAFGCTRILFTYNPSIREAGKEVYTRGMNSFPLNSIRDAAIRLKFPDEGPTIPNWMDLSLA